MKDRVSTKILDNGAARYGVYDEDGNLLRYEYIKLEDEPDEEGDFFNKANMLPDSIPALLGLKMANPQVKDALNVLANIGNVHVWSRMITLTSDGYQLSDPQEVQLISRGFGGYIVDFNVSSGVSVSEGTISLSSPASVSLDYNGNGFSSVVGKFIQAESGVISYVPASATFSYKQVSANFIMSVVGAQVVSYLPAGTHTDFVTSTDSTAYPQDGDVGDYHYTYLGQLGDPDAKIEVGSYVGTEKYGSSNPCSITFSFAPKVIMILYDRYLGTNIANDASLGVSRVVMDEITTSYKKGFGFGPGQGSYGKKSADGKTYYWYNNSVSNQYNNSNTKFYVLAIG